MLENLRTIGLLAAAIGFAGTAALPASAAQGRCVAYFYTQSDSAAPVGVTIKGGDAVTVKPVAPGHVSAAVVLPAEGPDPLYSTPAMKKALKAMGRTQAPPAPLKITFRSGGGATQLGLSLDDRSCTAGHIRAWVYFMRVAKPGAKPSPVDEAAVTIYDSDYKAAAQGKALVAVVNETGTERLTPLNDDSNAHFEVVFRKPDGSGWDEQNGAGLGLVTPETLKPGRYDLVNWVDSDSSGDTMSLEAIRKARPIGTLTPAQEHSGRIAIYLIRTPGKLVHVMDLPAS